MEEQALDAIVQIGLIPFDRQQQRHPNHIRWQTVDIVQNDDRCAQQRPRIHDEITVDWRASERARPTQKGERVVDEFGCNKSVVVFQCAVEVEQGRHRIGDWIDMQLGTWPCVDCSN